MPRPEDPRGFPKRNRSPALRVLLLNPPSHSVVVRDYLCSKTSKSGYLFHPIDLVLLSGSLASEHDVHVLDAVAEDLDADQAHARIEALAPEVVVSLVGSVSWPEDRAFLAEQARRGRRVVATGDVLHEASEERLREEPWIEAAPHAFANDDLLRYLGGEREELEDMTLRDAQGTPRHLRVGARHKRRGEYRVPRPRHELFPTHGYRFPFARSQRFATLLTDFGCPYPCTFCVIGTLGYRTRPVADVLEEIDHLRAAGTRELFVMDQTFGVQRERALELCAALEQRGDLSWTTFTRPDTATDELLGAMRRAGCHTLILGIESADDALLARYKKGYDTNVTRAAVGRAQAAGMAVVGTFVIGLPEESEASLEASLAFALELELDFLSLNMAVPRFGTPFRAELLGLGLVDPTELVMDQGGASAFLPTRTLDRDAMLALKRKLVRRFYLRPSWILRRLRRVSSWSELANHASQGWALLRANLGPR